MYLVVTEVCFERKIMLWFWPFKYFLKPIQHSVNTEHSLKSKLAWPVCTNEVKNGTGAMNTAKKKFLLHYKRIIVI